MKFHTLVRGHSRINPNRSNADLWTWVLQSVDRLGSENVLLFKVPAHRALHSATSRKEAWMFFHNDFADRAARLANQSRPFGFWQVWEQHASAAVAANNLFQQVRDLQLAVGRRQVQASVNVAADPEPEPVRSTRVFVKEFSLGQWTGNIPAQVARLFGLEIVRKAIAWFRARVTTGAGGTLEWISFHQLYIDFQLTWGHPGPIKVQRQWVDAAMRPYLAPEAFSSRVRVRWFRQMMKAIWQSTGVAVALQQCRPNSNLLQAYLPSASLPWDTRAVQEVETWLSTALTRPCTRDAGVLKSLPLAAKLVRMQVCLD